MEKSIDYDCIVREYKAEFKLDVSAVKDAIIEYRNEPSVMNYRKIQALWPKNNIQDFFDGYVGFRPLKNESSVRFQYSQAFGKSFSQHLSPVSC